MKIVVFGGSGFLGSHVADYLSALKYDVTIFDLRKSLYLQKGQKMVTGDILDAGAVLKAVKGADIVYNFAGIADINQATNDPVKTIQINVLGNTNILEACRIAGVKRYMFASTIYVYSGDGGVYRASKQACELFIECYHKKYGFDYTIMRYGSLYGPRADKTNWIQSIITEALNSKKIVRKGDGQEIREYIHVTDAARLSAKMIEKEYANQYVIITGQQMMRIKDVLGMLNEILGNTIQIEYIPSDKDGHYEITPYSFQPRFARKVTDTTHVDFGQGLIELLNLGYDWQNGQKPSSMERV